MFRSIGATPLDGGPTLNPSTYELLAGIHSVPAEEVVVLPNSANVRMAAERAAELSDKVVRVVAVALAAGRPRRRGRARGRSRGAEANAAAMGEALEAVRTGAVTEAARDDGEQRFRAGEAIGFVDEELVAWGDPRGDAARRAATRSAPSAELLTLIAGPDAPLGEDADRRR